MEILYHYNDFYFKFLQKHKKWVFPLRELLLRLEFFLQNFLLSSLNLGPRLFTQAWQREESLASGFWLELVRVKLNNKCIIN